MSEKQFKGPYFNDLNLKVQQREKRSARPAHGLRVVPVMNGCVVGITCNKPIRVSSPISFKSQLRLHYCGFAIYTVEFASAKTERGSERKLSCSCASK